MSESAAVQKPPSQGIITTLLSWTGRVISALMVSLCFSLAAEWVGIAFFWPGLGAQHSHMMMRKELGWFAQNVQQSLLSADPVGQLEHCLQLTWQWLFVNTKVVEWLASLRIKPSGEIVRSAAVYGEAAIYITLTFVLRVFILLLTAPLFLLAAITGVIDGLVRRDIRRFGCGYESGFVYHRAKRMVLPVFFLAWVIYLSLPFSIPPWVVLLPAAFLFGITVSITVGTFKKYI
ncbi:TIGR03747 family integrating conjugative element membrane protein [Buttiauxella selenatireducens]|uniref:TIGR03747 family integrating conjugative element membrane protein n=1 Tax=Buttiauxella selenatireducens TaxID=3073902 RepID=A0ABY9S661_9ENTR|nr:TIGR03747 family integrating conjugative element membrane protein [Buttiauxella sp. R73]WMY72488.1 TIGR03747 family integrating conjugative element membrane protein [Buttiauxella sp. R73]